MVLTVVPDQASTVALLFHGMCRCQRQGPNGNCRSDHEETFMHDNSKPDTYAQQYRDLPCGDEFVTSPDCFHILSFRKKMNTRRPSLPANCVFLSNLAGQPRASFPNTRSLAFTTQKLLVATAPLMLQSWKRRHRR
jgi:hypothetical protein